MVRLPHPPSGDSQGQETFLAPSADKKTRNYDTNLPRKAIVRLPHPRCGYSQCQGRFLAPFAEEQTSNYDTVCSNHHLS